MNNNISLQTYHLYHHQLDPLSPEMVRDQAWLLNNGVSYSVVATIQSRTPEEAYQAIREKMAGHGKLSRHVELRMGNFLRETMPGDVLVSEDAAWMVTSEAQIRAIPYESSRSWKSYGHDETVRCVRWAPNGMHVVAISKFVSIHNPYSDDSRRFSPTSYHHSGSYTGYAVEWAPDGRRIASGGYDGEVHVWKPDPVGGPYNAAAGSIVICRTEQWDSKHTRIISIAWAPDSRSLLAGNTKGDVVQWDAITGECLHVFKRHTDDVNTLTYSPDGFHIASASDDGTVRIWQVEDPYSLDVICQHVGAASSVAWSPNGTLLVSSCTKDQTLHFWDPTTGEPGERIPLSVSSTRILGIQTVAWSPDGQYIAAGCDDGTVQIVDVRLRRHVATYRTEAKHQIQSVAWSPDGKYLAVGGSNRWGSSGKVQIWQFEEDMATLSQNERDSTAVESGENPSPKEDFFVTGCAVGTE